VVLALRDVSLGLRKMLTKDRCIHGRSPADHPMALL
jgi:hypothetical protein